MKITLKQVESLNPCSDGLDWYKKNGTSNLLDTLLRLNEYSPDYVRWGFTKLMNKMQRVEIAIYCADRVIDIFEDKYPNDDRPRKAINAAKTWLKEPTEENRSAANAADAAANAAAYAAYAAAYAAYAADAAYAAAYAAADAADNSVAYAGSVDIRKQLQIDIILKAVEILERK